LTDAAVNQWVARSKANNTRRNRLARVCTFLRWCVRLGEADPALVEELQSRENPLRAIPPLYGKLQGKHPARWLTYEEATRWPLHFQRGSASSLLIANRHEWGTPDPGNSRTTKSNFGNRLVVQQELLLVGRLKDR
jgi:hypothetical protein